MSLTVRRGEVVAAETLADAWWGDQVPATWTKALQGCVVQLRKVLGAAAIEQDDVEMRRAALVRLRDARRERDVIRNRLTGRGTGQRSCRVPTPGPAFSRLSGPDACRRTSARRPE